MHPLLSFAASLFTLANRINSVNKCKMEILLVKPTMCNNVVDISEIVST